MNILISIWIFLAINFMLATGAAIGLKYLIDGWLARQKQKERDYYHHIHRLHRARQWEWAKVAKNAYVSQSLFKAQLLDLATLHFGRGADYEPTSLTVNLSGLFFRFISGNQEAIDIIAEAICAKVKIEFAEVMNA